MGRTKALRIVDKKFVRQQKTQQHTSGTKAAILIQRCYRGHCVRREVGEILGVVRRIQAQFRGTRVRSELREANAAAESVQSVLRGHQARAVAAALEADRQLKRADVQRRAERDAARQARQDEIPDPPSDDDEEDEIEATGLPRAERSRRGAAQSMLFATVVDGSTEQDVENIEGALEILGANVRNNQRATALHLASDVGFVPAVACLLGHGANANVHDRNGRTPLLLACRHGHRQVAAELLKSGAHPQAPGGASGSKPPMAVAIDRSDAVLAEMLAQAGGSVPATHAARGLLLGMRAKARSQEVHAGGIGSCQELILSSIELEAGDGYLTRLWEVVDTTAPTFCAHWPERQLIDWLRPRLALEFSGKIGSMGHDTMVKRARVVGASMLEREARQEAKRHKTTKSSSSGSTANVNANADDDAASSVAGSTPRSLSLSMNSARSDTSGSTAVSSDSEASCRSTGPTSSQPEAEAEAEPAAQSAASTARMNQFKKARKFLQTQEKRREKIRNKDLYAEEEQRSQQLALIAAIEDKEAVEFEAEIAKRKAAATMQAEASRRRAVQILPKLLRLALDAELATVEEVDMLRQSVKDGYTSAERSVEMWEDQLEKAGVLKNARRKRERRLASEAARRLIGDFQLKHREFPIEK